MAKVDKSKYSKAEWKRIRQERRNLKAQDSHDKVVGALRRQQIPEIAPVFEKGYPNYEAVNKDEVNNYVLCLKHGTKYSAEYVNTLYNMVKRNLGVPFKMACLTDNPKGINEDIECINIPHNLSGWWCKPYMYSSSLPLPNDCTILYMDLDVVISGPLDKLFTYQPGEWCVIRDFTRAMQPQWQKYNSSVIRFRKGQLNDVWARFIADPQKVIGSHFGDQDWLWTAAQGTAKLWPDEWIRSYKWEVRKDRHLSAGVKGERKFTKQENPKPDEQCSIAVFHGDPNPHNCDDPWVVENWK